MTKIAMLALVATAAALSGCAHGNRQPPPRQLTLQEVCEQKGFALGTQNNATCALIIMRTQQEQSAIEAAQQRAMGNAVAIGIGLRMMGIH